MTEAERKRRGDIKNTRMFAFQECEACHGFGRLALPGDDDPYWDEDKDCPQCEGTGVREGLR